jgi:hypothetical protein
MLTASSMPRYGVNANATAALAPFDFSRTACCSTVRAPAGRNFHQSGPVSSSGSRTMLRAIRRASSAVRRLGLPRLGLVVARVEVGQRLPVGVTHDVAVRLLVGAPDHLGARRGEEGRPRRLNQLLVLNWRTRRQPAPSSSSPSRMPWILDPRLHVRTVSTRSVSTEVLGSVRALLRKLSRARSLQPLPGVASLV